MPLLKGKSGTVIQIQISMDIEENYSTINEAYKIWKKHSPFLYTLLQAYQLPTCSQTVQWFADSYLEGDWKISSLLIGSNSLSQNSLQILSIGLPTDDSLTDYAVYREQRPELPIGANGYIGTMGQQQVAVKLSIPQASEIMRARINRFDQNLLAVKTGGANPETIIYDLRNKEEELENHAYKLTGHEEEGFGLAWSPLERQLLLSGSYDRKLLLYNLDRPQRPQLSWACTDGVQDVKWSAFNKNLAASAHSDDRLNLWDIRSGQEKPIISRKAHNGQVYSVDFNKKSEHLLLSGGQDGDVNLWDVRNMSKKLHSFIGHNDSVNTVTWNPHSPVQFATASSDRRVVLWDMERLNEGDKVGNEILFIHGGHRSKVPDVSWSNERGVLASCEENNIVQVWKMTESLGEK